MIRVSIIGTAGRSYEEQKQLNATVYVKMIQKSLDIICNEWKLSLDNVRLCSGGAAWADHVAVALFLTQSTNGLTIYFPCKYDEKTGRCDDTDYCGKRSNQLHEKFNDSIGSRNSFDDFRLAQMKNNNVIFDTSCKGFHARNSFVAKSEYCIAFTFGTDENEPKEGGTLDTWRKCKGTKVHVRIQDL